MAANGNSTNLTLEPHQIIYRPLVTKRASTRRKRYNAYAFEVHPQATKDDVLRRWKSCST